MAKRYLFAALLVLSGMLPMSVAAQPSFEVAPNPYDGAVDTSFVLRNVQEAPISLDSLRLDSGGGVAMKYQASIGGRVWSGYLVCVPFPPLWCSEQPYDFGAESVIGSEFARGDSVVFYGIVGFCPVCKSDSSDLGVDTLYVFAGGHAEPQKVVVANATFLETEDAQVFDEAEVRAYPNPARETVRVTLPRHAQTTVALYNVQGRQMGVYVNHAGDDAAEFSVRTLPAGLYMVRVGWRVGGGVPQWLTRLLVVQ